MRTRATVAALVFVVAALAAACFWDAFKPLTVPAVRPDTDLVVVEKGAHRMSLFHHGRLQQIYTIALGRGGAGPKAVAGDNKVPEGIYRIVGRNPNSAFHLSLRIGYPTIEQARNARHNGLDPGGDVMIHGIRNGLGWIGNLHRQIDWTRGCIAVTNSEIEAIWHTVPDGTPIVIKP